MFLSTNSLSIVYTFFWRIYLCFLSYRGLSFIEYYKHSLTRTQQKQSKKNLKTSYIICKFKHWISPHISFYLFYQDLRVDLSLFPIFILSHIPITHFLSNKIAYFTRSLMLTLVLLRINKKKISEYKTRFVKWLCFECEICFGC